MSNKFHAKKTQIDGIWFDSRAEGMHYLVLKHKERRGEIVGLTLQPEYVLVVNGELIGKYTPDFSYYDAGNYVCEDTKGVRTEAFALRAKLFQALYPDIELRVNGIAAKRPKPPKSKPAKLRAA
jgi:hypothetical protein